MGKFIRSTWSSKDVAQTEMLRRAGQAPPIRKRAGVDEIQFVDQHAKSQIIRSESHTKICDFEIAHHLESVVSQDGISSVGYSFVLWPNQQCLADFARKLSDQEQKHLAIVSLGASQD